MSSTITRKEQKHTYYESGIVKYGKAICFALLLAGAHLLQAQTVTSNALDFDGDNDYVQLPNASYFTQNKFTIEAWVYPKTYNYWSRVIDFSNGPASDNVLMAVTEEANGHPAGSVFRGGDGANFTANTAIALNTWSHLAITVDGSRAKIYINGVLNMTAPNASQVQDVERVFNYIGKSAWPNDGYADMILDELKIWNGVLTSDAIADNMYKKPVANQPGLLVYFDFDQGVQGGDNTSITSLIDKSGNGYDGTFYNFNLDGAGSNFVAGVEVSDGAIYTFVQEPVTIPSFISSCIGSQASIEATTTADVNSYQWYKDGQLLSGETGSTLTLSSVAAISAGVYKVKVENLLGFIESNELRLTTDCNKALRFDGSDDYVEIPDANVLDLASEFTIEAWIKPAGSGMTILSKSSTDNTGYKLKLSGDNNLVVAIDGLPDGELVSHDAIPTDVRTHVAVTFKAGVEGGVKMYINGLLNARTTCDTNVSANDFALRLGGYDGDDALFNGDMDEVRIWNEALPGSTILYNMNNKPVGNETKLIAYYDFDQGEAEADNTSITTLTDKTANNNNGTLHGFELNGEVSNFVSSATELTGTYVYQLAVQPSLPGGNDRNVLLLNGRDQSVEVSAPNFSATSGTYEVWVKKNNWSEFHDDILFANGTGHSANNSFYISLHDGAGLHFRYGGDGQAGSNYAAEIPGIAEFHYGPSSWHHIAATWSNDDVTGKTSLKLYVDGIQVSARSSDLVISSGTSFIIGYNPSSGYFGVGTMAEARLWNVAKTGTEIAAAMNSTLTGAEAGLIGYWPFNDGSGSDIVNKVAGSSNGVLINKSATSWPSTSVSSSLGSLWGMTSGGGTDNLGVLFKMAGNGTDFAIQKDFKFNSAGKSPYSDLVEWSNGKFYGMTSAGGKKGFGALFEYDPVSETTVAKFAFGGTEGGNPQGSLTLGSNGKFYGTTFSGGEQDLGVLFEFDPADGSYTKKIDFISVNGKNPRGRLASGGNGKLYGVANGGTANSGVLFEYDPSTSTLTKKYDFPGGAGGNAPSRGLTLVNGKLYGMTESGGTSNVGILYEYDVATETVAKKYDFEGASNGGNPGGYLTLGNDGILYGLTSQGGTSGIGVVFGFDLATYTYTKKADFTGANGDNPNASVTLGANGMLYGMTYQGGSSSRGVLFEFDPATGSLIAKVNFNGTNGRNPLLSSPVLGSNGKLYGMTSQGGDRNVGVLFEYDPSTSTYIRKISFSNPDDGGVPQGSVMQASNGKVYGMTSYGGTKVSGTLFEYDPSNSTFAKKIDFDRQVNGYAYGNLTEAANGKLYGITAEGGAESDGTLFEYDPASGKLTNKINFTDVGVSGAYGSLTLANGKLYGMTQNGGDNGVGAIFEYNPEDGTFTKKFDFDYAAGGYPYGSLTLANGRLYGMTTSGGDGEYGVIFEFNPEDGTYSKKFDFDYSTTGGTPYGDLTYVNGKLYGMTYQGGANDYGVLFEYDVNSGTYTVDFEFNYAFGAYPYGNLALSSNGLLYGMTNDGGANGKGTVFEFNPATVSLTSKLDFTGTNGAYPLYSGLFFMKADQTTTFGSLSAKTYGDAPFNLTATSTSSLPVTFTSSNPDIATISGNSVTIVGAGIVTITANQAGDGRYKAAPPIEQSLTINKAALTAKAENKSKVYGAENPLFAITYTGFVNGEDVSKITPPVPSVSATAASNAGEYPITLSGGTATNYAITLQNGTLTVNKAALTAKADNKSKVYGAANPVFTITYTGFVNDDDASKITAPVASVASLDAGNQTITLSGGTATNYAITLQNGTLTVEKAALTAKAENKSKVFGAANPALTITYTGFVNGDDVSKITAPTAAVSATATSDAGTYPVTLTGGAAANYTLTLQNGTLTIGKADQTITFAALATKTFGDANFTLTATSSSGLPVSYSSGNIHTAIANGTVTVISAGAETITATQPGNTNYNAAVAVSQSFCINPAKPVVTKDFANPAAPVLTSSATTGNQWYKDGAAISNASQTKFTVASVGQYSVKATVENCTSVMSDQVTIVITGIPSVEASVFAVTPNPATQQIEVTLGQEAGEKQLEVISMEGKVMHHVSVSGASAVVQVSDYLEGVYIVKIVSAKGSQSLRFVKR